MADLSSILGGMVQGFKDFGTGLVDFFGTGAANIGDIASSIATGRATTKNQDDFRKWLYQTDDKQDAAAKGLGTILNGVSTAADVMPGAQAVTANPLFNGLQGAIGGVSDELKMAGKDADWGRAAQRAGVGAASGLASAYAGQGLAKTGNKLLSNGLTRGAISGALGGGIANAGYTGIEGGSVQDMINAGLYGAQTGALVGGTTGLARELIKPNHKMDVALTDEEKAARIANIDDQIGKLDLNTPEGNARYNELMSARNKYTNTFYHGYSATPTETGDTLGEGMYMTTDKNRAGGYAKGGGLESYDASNLKLADLDDIVPENVAEVLKSNPQLSNRLKTLTPVTETFTDRDAAYSRWNALKNEFPVDQMVSRKTATGYEITYPGEADYSKITGKDLFRKLTTPEAQGVYMDAGYDGVSKTALGGDTEVAVYRNKERLVPRTVADLMNEPKPKTVADLMLSDDADIMASDALPGSNKKAKTTNGVNRIGSDNVAPVDESTLPKGWKELRDILDEKYVDDITKKLGYENGDFSKITPEQYEKYILDVQTSPGKKKGWQNQFEFKKSYMDADEYKNELKNIAIYEAKRKAINDIQDMDLPQAQKNAIDTAINSMDYYATDDNRRYLSHYMPGGEEQKMFANNAASEADAEFSDRLGIGRSNTIKRNNIWSKDLNADGEYKPDEYALAVDPLLNKENAVSTLAHERLHSFQFEAPQGRYDKRVLDAYNELSKDLKPYIHDQATVDERYGKYYKDNLDGKYWGSNTEQESRMMQQYLDNKGYTNRTVDGPRKNEYGEEINKAFDKFFKKLRTLSKKGVALPAVTALLGGGAIAGALTSGKDDKKKKSEVK